MLSAKKEKRVMEYVRKGMEEELKVVKEEDNIIILQEKKTKKRIGGVYANGRWHVDKWRGWLGSLEEEIGREGSLLRD